MTERGPSRRSFVRAAAIPVLLTGSAPPLLAACGPGGPPRRLAGAGALERARQRKRIDVGVANESPYAYTDKKGALRGQAPALAQQIFGALGITNVRPVQMPFSGLIAGLLARRYDAIAAGMFITPERCASIAFADPDYCVMTAFMVPKGNPDGIQEFPDIARQPDLRLGVLPGAVEGRQAKAAGVRAEQIKSYADRASAFDALRDNEVDAIALTRISLAELKRNKGSAGFDVTTPFRPGKSFGCGAFAFRKEDTDLLKAWNGELARLKRGSGLLEILTDNGFAKGELPGELRAKDLCG
jgi:polar amino acid transport system substrate-binding protein